MHRVGYVLGMIGDRRKEEDENPSPKDLDLRNKRALIRSDSNIPVDGKRIISGGKIRASLETIRSVVDSEAAKVIIASHLGRPERR